MPGVWARIEARQSLSHSIRRLASVFVASAAALVLAMAAYMARPPVSPVYTLTYVEALSDDETPDTLAYAELVSYEPPEEGSITE
jgi:hypothetical protein